MTMTESWSNQIIGLRYDNLFLPKGAVIRNATVQFTTKNPEKSVGYSKLEFRGEAAGNALPFEATNFNISDRMKTTEIVTWEPEEWLLQDETGGEQKTPNLASVIQEIVNQDDWETGNALALIITGEGQRSAHNYNSGFPATISIQAEIPIPDIPVSGLYINEIAPNGTEFTDEKGKHADWIEIYNDNDVPLSLGSLYLTDDIDNLSKWQIAAIQSIPAKGYLNIWADDDPLSGGFHANFKLSATGETLALVQALNNEFIIIDSVSYTPVPFKSFHWTI